MRGEDVLRADPRDAAVCPGPALEHGQGAAGLRAEALPRHQPGRQGEGQGRIPGSGGSVEKQLETRRAINEPLRSFTVTREVMLILVDTPENGGMPVRKYHNPREALRTFA